MVAGAAGLVARTCHSAEATQPSAQATTRSRRHCLMASAVTTMSKIRNQSVLSEHAAEIRALGKHVFADVIEIGRRLVECKGLLGHGNWLPWLEREFGWGETTALNYMRAHELASKSAKFADLSLPVSAIYLLAAPSTSEEDRTEFVERSAAGERFTVGDVLKKLRRKRRVQPRVRATNFRTMKLGEEVMEKIKGTTLDSAEEMNELVILNRGAEEGQNTPLVKQLVADAAAGKDISAIAAGSKILSSRRGKSQKLIDCWRKRMVRAWELADKAQRAELIDYLMTDNDHKNNAESAHEEQKGRSKLIVVADNPVPVD
jgi:hypothetical protein